ncbi:MAG: hypothetical protein KJN93_07690, partial [Alphaproteobacteria bacterium]|nr:hypothetical protein [Alphaproteobacteria bacterium]
RMDAEPTSETQQAALRASVNPALIPRNHRIEEAIEAGIAGNYAPFERLSAVLARPFEDQGEAADLARPPEPDQIVRQTFCGT